MGPRWLRITWLPPANALVPAYWDTGRRRSGRAFWDLGTRAAPGLCGGW